MEISELPNIGKGLAEQFIAAGISTGEELKKIGSVNALILLNGKTYTEGCLNKLYAFEGAIQGIRWHNLSKEERTHLKNLYYSEIGKN